MVEVSAEGLPLRVEIARAELRFGAAYIAEQVLRQCRAAALVAGLANRQQLEALGVDPATLSDIGLPTVADVARSEAPHTALPMGAPPAERALAPSWGGR